MGRLRHGAQDISILRALLWKSSLTYSFITALPPQPTAPSRSLCPQSHLPPCHLLTYLYSNTPTGTRAVSVSYVLSHCFTHSRHSVMTPWMGFC